MGKPSIFSNQYRREMKRRRNRIIIIVVAIIVIAVLGIILITGSLSNYKFTENSNEVKKVSEKNTEKTQNISVKNEASKTNKQEDSNKQQNTPAKVFTVNMADGKTINITYDDTNSVRKITNIQNGDPDIDFNINPSGTFAVAYEKSKQNIMLINADGTSSDITNTSYTSSNGTAFSKDSILSQKSDYIWQQSPKFIDDDNIAYISQLPWFNKTSKYIWKYNIKDKTNINTNITGTNVKMNNMVNGKGLEIVVDNVTEYLKPDGSVVSQ